MSWSLYTINSVYTNACEAFEISSSMFCNHILRSKHGGYPCVQTT